MEKTNVKITRYKYGDFFVDIVDDGEVFEAFLLHKDYGVSSMMFGVQKKDIIDGSEERFVNLVEGQIVPYLADYMDEYMGE